MVDKPEVLRLIIEALAGISVALEEGGQGQASEDLSCTVEELKKHL